MGGTGTADGSPGPETSPGPANSPGPESLPGPAGTATPGGPALESLYQAHYLALVRLAALLTTDALMAEEIAADAVAAMLSSGFPVRLPERVLFRLRQQVVLRARAAGSSPPAPEGRHRGGLARPDRAPDSWQDSAVVRVLASLAPCEREAVVLRHYLGLREREVAAIMGTSTRVVRSSLAIISDAAFQPLLGSGLDS